MRLWHLSMFTLVVSGLISSLGFCQEEKTYNANQVKQQIITPGWWTRVLRNDFPQLQFFLDELAIPTDQAEELTELFAEYRKKIHRTIIEEYTILGEEIKFAESDAERVVIKAKQELLEKKWSEELPLEFVSKLEEILLPHQIERFNQAIYQRHFMETGWQSFEFVAFVSRQMKLTDDERAEFGDKASESTFDFVAERQKLKDAAWKRLEEELPEKLIKGMEEIMGQRVGDREFEMYEAEKKELDKAKAKKTLEAENKTDAKGADK